ncbi:MAG TPA: zinc ribbon domain-containing protein [Pyrinomonadaceae bacterium]|nr:zinc ribbon domain-containing protein [Pyrinomonadaceae bacterium]
MELHTFGSPHTNYYFVAESAGGGFVGQLPLEEIAKQLRDGKMPGNYVAAKSSGPSYSQLLKSGTANWITVADLVGNWSAHNARVRTPVDTATKASSCAKCSTPLDEDAKFCPSCATPVLLHFAPHCPNCFKPVDAGAKFCKNCAADLTPKREYDASAVSALHRSVQELQRGKANRLAIWGGITAGVSALAFLWGYTYSSNWSNMAHAGLSSLVGQTDSTYILAQWCITLGAIGFLVGLILLIVGLAQR